MNFKKLPLSVAVAAAVGAGSAYAGSAYADDHPYSSVEIDKEIVYNQNIGNTGQILTLGLILVDSSAVAVSEVKQSSEYNTIVNEFDTLNDADVSNTVLQGATGNIGVNIAAGDNNVQQNSVAIANASSGASSIDLHVDYTQGEVNHSELVDHSDYHDDYNDNNQYAESYSGAWRVEGSVDYDHATTESITVDSWDVHTDSTLELDGDAVGVAGAASGAHTSGMAAWGEYGMGGGSVGGALFLNDKDETVPGEEGAPDTTIEGHETQGYYTATTSGNAAGSAEFTEDESIAVDVSGFAGEEYSYSNSGSDEYNEEYNETYDYKETHDDDYRLNVEFDADFVFGGSADAETFSEQYAFMNNTINNGVRNLADVGDNVAEGAAGNIGINVAAGNSNVQTNQLALANNDGVLSTATASSYQVTAGNITFNNSLQVTETETVGVVLSTGEEVFAPIVGNVTQAHPVYLDIWEGSTSHTGGSGWGHADLDRDQGGDGNGDENWLDMVIEEGYADLSNIELTGTITYERIRYQGHRNDASLGDNALANASGNIGVNIAAGTNNLQGNALAISNASVPVAPTPTPGE